MKTSETNGVSVKDSTAHTADIKSAQDIDFLRLTTDICYVISGFYAGKLPDCESYMFMTEYNETVWLDMDENVIDADDRLTRLQMYALETIANDHGLEFDIHNEEQE